MSVTVKIARYELRNVLRGKWLAAYGLFFLGVTIVMLQFVGDSAGETGTRLNWTGPAGDVALRLEGPSRATLRDFYVHAPNGRGLVVEDADQTGGRIVADQLNTNGPGQKKPDGTAALRINGLDQSDVLCRALQGNGNAGHWVEVLGGPAASRATNQVSVLTGATG